VDLIQLMDKVGKEACIVSATGGVVNLIQLTTGHQRALERYRLSVFDQPQKLSATVLLCSLGQVMLPPGGVELRSEQSFAAQRGGERLPI